MQKRFSNGLAKRASNEIYYINFVSLAPLLMVVTLGDHLTVADEALAAYERALEPKKLVTLAGGHFDAYVKDFEGASTPARDWFVAHLRK